MLFVNGVGCNLPSIYCMAIIGLQLTIISLFYYDLLEGGSDGNKLNIPLTVSAQVRGTEFLALPLAVMAHEDCLTALHLTRVRFNYEVTRDHPRATHYAWNLTLFVRFFVGFLLVFVSFIQIMQADNVTDLFLNFESIVFVSSLDNAAYWLASAGFLKQELRDAAENRQGSQLPTFTWKEEDHNTLCYALCNVGDSSCWLGDRRKETNDRLLHRRCCLQVVYGIIRRFLFYHFERRSLSTMMAVPEKSLKVYLNLMTTFSTLMLTPSRMISMPTSHSRMIFITEAVTNIWHLYCKYSKDFKTTTDVSLADDKLLF